MNIASITYLDEKDKVVIVGFNNIDRLSSLTEEMCEAYIDKNDNYFFRIDEETLVVSGETISVGEEIDKLTFGKIIQKMKIAGEIYTELKRKLPKPVFKTIEI